MFPEPSLSSADVVQQILDFVVAKRLPRVVLEDSVLYASRKLAHLASVLLMLLPLPKFYSLILASLVCFLRKSRQLFPLSLRKSRICFLSELSNLHLHISVVRLTISCQCANKILPRNRFILMSGSEKFSLLMNQRTSSRFELCSLCNQLNSFLRSKNCW